jgi:hypothetical protein
MRSDPVKPIPRILLVPFSAVAAIAAAVFGLYPASAATPGTATSGTGVSLSLSPRSGGNYSTNKATLSWTVPSACVGQEIDAFLYPGTGAWNKAAIDTAEGVNGGQTSYFDFSSQTGAAAAATGSASWPNVPSGYLEFGTSDSPVYPTTAALVAAQGTGYYTMALACVNSTTFTPITNSSGHPIARAFVVKIGATGHSWKVSSATATQVALTGHGIAVSSKNPNGKLSLAAHVTSDNGSVPAGGLNLYPGPSATGTPLNGATPIPVASNGWAHYSGPSGYPAGVAGAQDYFAQFVPASRARYLPASGPGVINLIKEWVTLKVTASKDSSSASSLDLIAHGAGRPASLATLVPGGGVNFIVDGNEINGISPITGLPVPFPFNSNGDASHIVTGLVPGTHTITAELTDSNDDLLNPVVGYKVTANTVTKTTG